MKKILLMVYYDLKIYLQDYKTLLLIIMAPLLLLLLIGYAVVPSLEEQSLGEPFDVAVVNRDASAGAETIVGFITDNEELKELFEFSLVDYDTARDKLDRDELAAVIIIPPEFSRDMARGGRRNIEFIGNHRQPLPSAFTEAMIKSGTRLVTAAQSGVNTVYHYLDQAQISRHELGDTLRQTILSFFLHSMGRKEVLKTETLSPWGEVTPLEYYSVSLILIFLLLGGMTTLRGAADNKEGARQRLWACGVSPSQVVLSGFISTALLLAVQAAAIFTLFALFMDNFYRGETLHTLAVMLAVVLASAGLLVLLSHLATNLAAANLGWFVFIIVMAVTGGSIIPLTLLPAWMEYFHPVSFFGWASQGLYYSLFGAYDTGAVLGSAAVLSATALLALFLGTLILKKRLE